MAIMYEQSTSLASMVINGEDFTQVLNPAATATLPVSATIEVKGTDRAVLIPRLSTEERFALDNSIFTVIGGMKVYDTDLNAFYTYIDGSGWQSPHTFIKDYETVFDNVAINGMFLNSITLLPAPGEGYFYSIINISVGCFPGNVPFIDGGNVGVGYEGGNSAINQDINVAIITSVDQAVYFENGWVGENLPFASNISLGMNGVENKAIVMQNLGQPFDDGDDSLISVRLTYRIVKI